MIVSFAYDFSITAGDLRSIGVSSGAVWEDGIVSGRRDSVRDTRPATLAGGVLSEAVAALIDT